MYFHAFLPVYCVCGQEQTHEGHPYDGWGNNLANPSWGGAGNFLIHSTSSQLPFLYLH